MRWPSFIKRPKPAADSSPDLGELVVPALVKEEEDAGHPTFLHLASLSGTSRKDAEAVARGLADQMLTSVEIGRVHVYDDQARGRMIIEIHEGGPGRSIAQKVAEALDANQPVQIALANNAILVVDRTHDQIFSLIHQDDEQSKHEEFEHLRPITDFAGEVKLSEIFPDRNGLASLGGVLLGLSLITFLVSGAVFTVIKSGAAQPDALFAAASSGVVIDASDNPAWQLDRARTAAEKEDKRIKMLRKDARGWNWEFQP